MIDRTEQERFWSKVDKTEACWLWTAARDHLGYGRFRSRSLGSSGFLAHRYAWTVIVGSIPRDLDVLHRCDVRNCVNPSHLFLGTHADNMADMIAKGRATNPRGEQHGNAVLTEDSVRSIRERRAQGESGVSLAREFNVTPTTICYIAKRKSWSHV